MQAVRAGYGDADALIDASADVLAAALADGSPDPLAGALADEPAVGEADGEADGEAVTRGVGSGSKRDGMDRADRTNIRTTTAATIMIQGLASVSLRGGSAPR